MPATVHGSAPFPAGDRDTETARLDDCEEVADYALSWAMEHAAAQALPAGD